MVDEEKSIQDRDAGRFLYDQWAAERVTLSQNIVERERILQRACRERKDYARISAICWPKRRGRGA
jgi:hypothetical protein